MTIPFGRHRLILALVAAPREATDIPAAVEATDAELARLNRHDPLLHTRQAWETEAMLLGLRRG